MGSNEDYLDQLLAGAINHNTASISADDSEAVVEEERNDKDSSILRSENDELINEKKTFENAADEAFEDAGDSSISEQDLIVPIVSDNPYEKMSQEELADFLAQIGGADIIKPQAPVEPKQKDIIAEKVEEEPVEVVNEENIDEINTEINDEINDEINIDIIDDNLEEVSEELSEEASMDALLAGLLDESLEETIEENIEEPIEETIEETIDEPAEEFIEEQPIEEQPIEEFIEEANGDDLLEAGVPEIIDEPIFTDDVESLIENVVDDVPVEEAIEEAIETPIEESIETPVDDDPNKMMSPDDIAALIAGMDGAGEPAEEPANESAEEVPEEPIETPVDDDPNKMMSPDDIAALIAGMDGAGEPAEEPANESAEEVPEEPIETPVDDDPNKMMSPDDIAALIAGMDGAGEPAEEPANEPAEEVPEEPLETPVDDDPNKMMSPDDIAALIAGMDGAGEPAEEVTEEPIETPVDDDPNKMMSPDDIAALIAGMDDVGGAEESTEESKEESKEEAIEEAAEPAELSDEEIDKESDELMSLLMEDDNDNALGQDDFSLDFDEEDIMKQLENAKAEGEAMANSEALGDNLDNADVTDIVEELGLDGEIGEIADVLNKSDNAELVDKSIANEPENVAAFDPAAEEKSSENGDNEEDNKEGKGKKKKKKGLFAKLFGKKNAEEESEEGSAEAGTDNASDESAKVSADSASVASSADNSSDISLDSELSESVAALDNVVSAADIFNSEAAVEDTDDGAAAFSLGDEPEPEVNAESEEAKEAKEPKEKKKGFFAKLFDALTEEVEDEPAVAEDSQLKISDENKKALAELDGEEDIPDKKDKKKKKEKPKKEKKEKPKKPKKPKKEKLKDPKEDNAKKIPKKHVGIIVLLAISILVVLMLITSQVPKGMVLSDGRDAYYSGNYKDAFLYLYGKDLNDSDQMLYDRAKAIVILDRKYESYENYKSMGMNYEALNALLEGIRKYDGMRDRAVELGVSEITDDTKTRMLAALYNDYGITEEEAYDIIGYSMIDYTLKLDSVINGTEFVKSQSMINSMFGLDSAVDANIVNDVVPDNSMEDLLPEEEEYLNSLNNSEDSLSDNSVSDNDVSDDSTFNDVNNEQFDNVRNVEVQIESQYF